MSVPKRSFSSFTPWLLALGLTACGGPRPVGSTAPLSTAVTERGEPIYVGTVFPLDGSTTTPAFVYTRRVQEQGGRWVSTHVTRDREGHVAIAESATHTIDYALGEYTLHQDQRGQRGSVRVEEDRVVFHLTDEDGEHEAVEDRSDPVVVGPTLVGHIVRHLGALRAGEPQVVRMAILERLETLGFELEAVDAPRGQTVIRMTPTSFLVGLVVDPIDFTFETATSKLVRLEGRVPPKSVVEGSLHDLDARVEYRFLAHAYR